jgi:glucan 1,3-beta-glucosidase
MNPTPATLRGVNLGNWLLLEKWMRPRLFEGTAARDEYTLGEALGTAAEPRILRHRDEYITEADFAWIARRGLDAVRVPFGYWLFEKDPPFVPSPRHLDLAVDLAEKHSLKVVLDLHGLPGSQGPNDHTGRAGFFRWHTDPGYVERSLDLIEQVAQRYAGRKAVAAFSVINEPEPAVGRDALVRFYERAHDRVRRHMPAEEVAFVLAAYPEGELGTYHGCLPGRANAWTDVHLYQCFGEDWRKMSLPEYLAYPLLRQARLRPQLERGPVIVGEWSLGISPRLAPEIEKMPPHRQDLTVRLLGLAQLAMLEEFTGWFFWSYRADDRPHWSFRDAVERGWLPDRYDPHSPLRT